MIINGRLRTGLRTRVECKRRLAQVIQCFEQGDVEEFARLAHDAYTRCKFGRMRDRWFSFVEGNYRACPLAILMLDCFPHYRWKRWTDWKAKDKAWELAEEACGRHAVDGFQHGIDGVSLHCFGNLQYEHGFKLGQMVWAILNCLDGQQNSPREDESCRIGGRRV